MLNVTNPVGKDKSRWPKDNLRCPKGNTAETFGVPDLYLATTTWGRCDRPASIADAVRSACTLTTAWLIGLPRRAGRRLFAINDAEAAGMTGRSPRPAAASAVGTATPGSPRWQRTPRSAATNCSGTRPGGRTATGRWAEKGNGVRSPAGAQ